MDPNAFDELIANVDRDLEVVIFALFLIVTA
jgi:hypothetical protein